jgi:hypothetical protein
MGNISEFNKLKLNELNQNSRPFSNQSQIFNNENTYSFNRNDNSRQIPKIDNSNFYDINKNISIFSNPQRQPQQQQQNIQFLNQSSIKSRQKSYEIPKEVEINDFMLINSVIQEEKKAYDYDLSQNKKQKGIYSFNLS